MKIPQSGLHIDNPAWPLLQAGVAYWGITSGAGNALGTTLVCADLDNHPTYVGNRIKVLAGGAWGQDREIVAHAAGGILTLGSAYTDATGAAQQIVAGTPFVILSGGGGISNVLGMLSRPGVNLYEGWQDELSIDFTIWTVTNPVAGAAWVRGAIGELLMVYAAPNANNNCRIRSNQRWVAAPTLWGTARILRRLNLEFEVHIVGLANLDNVNFFMGLTPAVGDLRTTNNIMGWGLVGAGNALQTVTDAGGAETVATGFGENLLVTNKLRMIISLNRAEFLLNEVAVAAHVVNLPNAPFYLNFYAPTGPGGAATIRIGTVRVWPEDIA